MNIRIKTKTDYAMWRFFLQDLQTKAPSEARDERIVEIKRALRKWHRRGTTDPETKMVWSDDDSSYMLLHRLPEYIQTRDEAEEYFDSELRRVYQWGPYDCTGQHFTRDHLCFQRQGRWMAYHQISVDI